MDFQTIIIPLMDVAWRQTQSAFSAAMSNVFLSPETETIYIYTLYNLWYLLN